MWVFVVVVVVGGGVFGGVCVFFFHYCLMVFNCYVTSTYRPVAPRS